MKSMKKLVSSECVITWGKATSIAVAVIAKRALPSTAEDAGLVGRGRDIRILLRHGDPVVRRMITSLTWPTRLLNSWGVCTAYGVRQDCSASSNRCVGSDSGTWQRDRPNDDSLCNLCSFALPEFGSKDQVILDVDDVTVHEMAGCDCRHRQEDT